MKGGNVQEFMDTLSLGMEKEFLFQERTLFVQGGENKDGTWTMTLDQWKPPVAEYLWSFTAQSMEECLKAFESAPLFDGKTFWEAENQMEWIYG